jgi:hypothetical protein
MPYNFGSFNIHTNVVDLGAAVSVSEIDGLERVTTAEGELSLSGANVFDVGNITAIGVTTQSLISAVATLATATIDALTSTTATMATATINALTSTTATIDALNSTVATIVDLTVKTLHMDLLRLKDLVVDNLAEFNNIVVSGEAKFDSNAIVAGSLIANNIVSDRPHIQTDENGNYQWEHGRILTSPVMYYASVAENLVSMNPFPIPYEVTLYDASPTSVIVHVWERLPYFFNNSPVRNFGLNLNLLAIGA